MNPIFPIFVIKSNEETLTVYEINNENIVDFGNGFFFSNNGLIASVAHVLNQENGTNAYALFNGKMHRIEILSRKLTKKDENHIDAAIGRLDLKCNDYLDPSRFKGVEENSELRIKGFSRKILIEGLAKNIDLLKTKSFYYEIQARCFDLTYGYNNMISRIPVNMKNSFTLIPDPRYSSLAGLSGSPILNLKNEVVGLFKGGVNLKGLMKCQAMNINIIKEMVWNY
jgi:hypothetical protein